MTFKSIEEIRNKYPKEMAAVERGEDLFDYVDLYDALFWYYCHNGEMPYGTAKARDGDPVEWITDRLDSPPEMDIMIGAV